MEKIINLWLKNSNVPPTEVTKMVWHLDEDTGSDWVVIFGVFCHSDAVVGGNDNSAVWRVLRWRAMFGWRYIGLPLTQVWEWLGPERLGTFSDIWYAAVARHRWHPAHFQASPALHWPNASVCDRVIDVKRVKSWPVRKRKIVWSTNKGKLLWVTNASRPKKRGQKYSFSCTFHWL